MRCGERATPRVLSLLVTDDVSHDSVLFQNCKCDLHWLGIIEWETNPAAKRERPSHLDQQK